MTHAFPRRRASDRQELVPQPGNDMTYGGFINVNPDGAIAQVSWTWSAGRGMTRASRNTEHSLIVPRYKQRLQASRSEEHTSELQSLMRTSYAVFCLKKKNTD